MRNTVTKNQSLSSVLDKHSLDILLRTNCHGVATVEEFDSSIQTIKATMNYKKKFIEVSADGVSVTKLVDYPVLIDVPIIIMKGGPAAITFPVQAGDQCLICFNDRDIDNWFATGDTTNAPDSMRLHSFSDGIAIVGLNDLSSVIKNYDTTHAILKWGQGARVGVSATKVLISNSDLPASSLGFILSTMLTAIGSATTVAQVAAAASAANVALCTGPTALLE